MKRLLPLLSLTLLALGAGCANGTSLGKPSASHSPSNTIPPVSVVSSGTRDFNQVKTGQSTKQEVRALLGAPVQVSNDPVWGEAWEYPGTVIPGATKAPPAQVFFGPDGRVWRVWAPTTGL